MSWGLQMTVDKLQETKRHLSSKSRLGPDLWWYVCIWKMSAPDEITSCGQNLQLWFSTARWSNIILCDALASVYFWVLFTSHTPEWTVAAFCTRNQTQKHKNKNATKPHFVKTTNTPEHERQLKSAYNLIGLWHFYMEIAKNSVGFTLSKNIK